MSMQSSSFFLCSLYKRSYTNDAEMVAFKEHTSQRKFEVSLQGQRYTKSNRRHESKWMPSYLTGEVVSISKSSWPTLAFA